MLHEGHGSGVQGSCHVMLMEYHAYHCAGCALCKALGHSSSVQSSCNVLGGTCPWPYCACHCGDAAPVPRAKGNASGVQASCSALGQASPCPYCACHCACRALRKALGPQSAACWVRRAAPTPWVGQALAPTAPATAPAAPAAWAPGLGARTNRPTAPAAVVAGALQSGMIFSQS